MAQEKFTIGIEEEYQLIDPETRELTSYIQEFLDSARVVLRDQVKPEFLQSQVEVGSKVCETATEARREQGEVRRGGGHASIHQLDLPGGDRRRALQQARD